MTATSLYVPYTSGWFGQWTPLKVELKTNRTPLLAAGALWGTLRFEVDGAHVRTINVYRAGWHQADYYGTYGARSRSVKVTFTPSAVTELTDSVGSGSIRLLDCVSNTGCAPDGSPL